MNYIVYIIATGSALILSLLLKQPLLPEEPKRQSWTLSAIFPTAVLALGFTAMIAKLGYLTSSYTDYIIALAIGVITAFFSKFILEKILPRPAMPDEVSEINQPIEKLPGNPKPSEKPSESDKVSEVSKPDMSSKSQEESHE